HLPGPLGVASVAERVQCPLSILAAPIPCRAVPETMAQAACDTPAVPPLAPTDRLHAAPHQHAHAERLPLAAAPGGAVSSLYLPAPRAVVDAGGAAGCPHGDAAAQRLRQKRRRLPETPQPLPSPCG